MKYHGICNISGIRSSAEEEQTRAMVAIEVSIINRLIEKHIER